MNRYTFLRWVQKNHPHIIQQYLEIIQQYLEEE